MSFDTLAPCYRSMEAFLAGPILQRARTTFLAETQSAHRALLLGEGPGRFLAALLQSNPKIQITCIENSPRMIREAQRQLTPSNRDRVTFQQTDALVWRPSAEKFDLISTHFFLDCFQSTQVQTLVPKIAATAAPNARWLLTDFCIPNSGWQKLRAHAIHALMYTFFRVITRIHAARLTPPDPYLQSSGFHLAARQFSNHGLIHSDFWARKNS